MDMTIRREKNIRNSFDIIVTKWGKRIDCFGIYDLDVSLLVENCEGK